MKQIALFLILSLIACKKQSKNQNKSKELNVKIEMVKPVKKLVSGFKFTEGPAVDAKGNVYFSDIPNSKIWIWTTADSLKLYRENSHGSNGLFFDNNQNLLACEGLKARITSTNPVGDYKTLASQYQGKPFNQTNDLWSDKKGGVYFTDPKYDGNINILPQGGMHVFYITPYGKVIKVCEDLTRPNGIIGTPDGKTLFVSDRGAGKTYQYHIKKDGSLINKTLFVNLGSDGMTIDQANHIYITTKDKSQIDVFSKNGQHLKTLKIPEYLQMFALAEKIGINFLLPLKLHCTV
ncbi:SMP-30/gluconolactonase/LRE family protein [Flavobacterium sp. CS20]|uniref:SMP-30/gluconolactonase/LRE family protein n=1 Tax=Flavobacterium sp. CS20 TaxID=2775246 RepID=UPI001FFD004D|nr:SMP-30/gluconolactonase/LRE family protein [Flavobacterium sp. CS20]